MSRLLWLGGCELRGTLWVSISMIGSVGFGFAVVIAASVFESVEPFR